MQEGCSLVPGPGCVRKSDLQSALFSRKAASIDTRSIYRYTKKCLAHRSYGLRMLAKDEKLLGGPEGVRRLHNIWCILETVPRALEKNVYSAVWPGRVISIQTSWLMVLLKCPTSYLIFSLVALFITASVILKSPVIIAELSVSLINLSAFCSMYFVSSCGFNLQFPNG